MLSCESMDVACDALLYLIGKEEVESSVYFNLICSDLLGKFQKLESAYLKRKISCSMIEKHIPESKIKYYKYITGDAGMFKKTYFDVLIFTVVPNEFKAAISLLELDQDARELTTHGFRFWKCRIKCKRTGKELSCLVSMIGEATNSFSAVAATTALCKYQFGLAILVGIAAGTSNTKFADVIIADRIIDYETKRVEVNGEKNRPHVWSIDETLRKQVDYFLATLDFAKLKFSDLFREKESLFKLDKYKCDPHVSRAVILAGDKLIADGSTIPKLVSDYHQEAKAIEMESNGFALACESYNVPWMVFRGISDFGDPDKSKLKKYQQNAALSAILACKLFLEESYDTYCQNDGSIYPDASEIDF